MLSVADLSGEANTKYLKKMGLVTRELNGLWFSDLWFVSSMGLWIAVEKCEENGYINP